MHSSGKNCTCFWEAWLATMKQSSSTTCVVLDAWQCEALKCEEFTMRSSQTTHTPGCKTERAVLYMLRAGILVYFIIPLSFLTPHFHHAKIPSSCQQRQASKQFTGFFVTSRTSRGKSNVRDGYHLVPKCAPRGRNPSLFLQLQTPVLILFLSYHGNTGTNWVSYTNHAQEQHAEAQAPPRSVLNVNSSGHSSTC
jgi:hypothetical protein